MAADNDQAEEKTEQATDHKLRKARERGNIPTSKDTIELAGFICIILYLIFAMRPIVDNLVAPIILSTERIGDADALELGEVVPTVATGTALVVMPILVLKLIGSFITSILVNKGIVFAAEKLKPDVRKFNPLTNAKEKFKRRNLTEFLKTTLTAFAIMTIFGVIFYLFLGDILLAALCDLACGIDALTSIIKLAVIAVVLLLLAVVVIDLRMQQALFLHDQRMTKTELKREYKDIEGDPLIKSSRRSLGQQLLSQTAESALKSTVAVLTDIGSDTAVGVWHPGSEGESAKGVVTMACNGAAAASFIDKAREKGVAIIELPDLATILSGSLPMQTIVSNEVNEALHRKLRSFGLVG